MSPEINEFFTNKRILVTGGAGFIGSNLCEALLAKGARVVCLDNFSTGYPKNILEFTAKPAFKLIVGDIRNPADCEKACAGVDYVLHHAALGSVPRSIEDPATTDAVNVGGFVNMLIAARDAGVKRFIYAASSSTYGDSAELPKTEEKIGRPLSPYAVTKYVNELYADVFARTYGMETIGLRYFNVFGPRQDPEGAYAAVIPKFVMQFMAHDSPVINGDGSFSRDFTYIDNVIQINELAMKAENSESLNTVYNVAVGERISLNDLADTLKGLLSAHDPAIADLPILHGPERLGDVPHSQASIEKARRLLGYNPQYNVQDGLKEAVTWYADNL
ncbi:MAG: SDR family oxidoreductase [Desulfatiglandaceae bacterium]